MTRRPLWLALTLCSMGCATTLRVPILEPAAVHVDEDVRTVGLVDRSDKRHFADSASAVLAGATRTGEVAARTETMDALTEVLAASPRFEIVRVTEPWEAPNGPPVAEGPLAQRMCDELGVDAVIWLEEFDVSTMLDRVTQPQAPSRSPAQGQPTGAYGDPGRAHVQVRRETWLATTWQLRSAAGDLLDEHRERERAETWEDEGRTPVESQGRLPPDDPSLLALGKISGAAYGRHIAPHWVDVKRFYFSNGHPDLERGGDALQAGDLATAESLWGALAEDPDAATAGRALYNLGVSAEVQGALDRAVTLVEQARGKMGGSRTDRYLELLHARQADQEQLRTQLGAASEASDDD